MMAESEFERFKKRYPGGKKDMKVQAIPTPLPGPGGIARFIGGKAAQTGIRMFKDIAKEVAEGTAKTAKKPAKRTEPRDSSAKSVKKPAAKKTEPRDSGTLTSKSRMDSAKKSRGPFPVPARRGNTLPARVDNKGRAIVRYNEPGVPAVRNSNMTRPARVVGVSSAGRKALVGAGAAGMMAGGYYAAKKMGEKDRANAANRSETKTGIIGGAGVTGTGNPRNPHQLGANATERKYFYGDKDKKAPIPKARPAQQKKSVAAKPAERKTFKKPDAPKKPAFKGNWVNAAPTEMQARAGARRKFGRG